MDDSRRLTSTSGTPSRANSSRTRGEARSATTVTSWDRANSAAARTTYLVPPVHKRRCEWTQTMRMALPTWAARRPRSDADPGGRVILQLLPVRPGAPAAAGFADADVADELGHLALELVADGQEVERGPEEGQDQEIQDDVRA